MWWPLLNRSTEKMAALTMLVDSVGQLLSQCLNLNHCIGRLYHGSIGIGISSNKDLQARLFDIFEGSSANHTKIPFPLHP